MIMRLHGIIFSFVAVLFVSIPAVAQVDRHDVRSGNRRFSKEKYREAEIDYRKALLKDTVSMAANYNLASTLYREENYEEAAKAMDRIKEVAPASSRASDYHYNAGDIALARKDYAAAVEFFKQSLLSNPGDLDAKENYIYAKKMLENQQNNGGSGGDNNQDRNQDQNQDQDQNQNQDQNQDQDQNQSQQQQPQEQKLSSQQAQQMLKAVQAQEKKTQEKVNREKAELLKTGRKEKNW